jgi:hypothetical protein
VNCPAGGGTITCSTPQGIAPGGQATFLFRLQATPDAQPGTITGTISAGASISVNVSVAVDVPPINDDIELTVSTWHEIYWDPRVDVQVRNKGPRAGTLKLDVSSSENIVVFTPCRECSRTDKNSIHCVTDLDKGGQFRMSVWAFGLPHRGGTITVTATLGNATKTVTVPVKLHPDHPPVVDPVKSPAPTTTTVPPTTTTTPPPVKPTEPTKPGTPAVPTPTVPTPALPPVLPPSTTVPTPTVPPSTPVPTTPPPTSEPCQPWPGLRPPLIPDLLGWPCEPARS